MRSYASLADDLSTSYLTRNSLITRLVLVRSAGIYQCRQYFPRQIMRGFSFPSYLLLCHSLFSTSRCVEENNLTTSNFTPLYSQTSKSHSKSQDDGKSSVSLLSIIIPACPALSRPTYHYSTWPLASYFQIPSSHIVLLDHVDKNSGLTVAPVWPASMSADLRGLLAVVILASSVWPSWAKTCS